MRGTITDAAAPTQNVRSLIRNYVSFAGMVMTFTSLARIVLLFLIDLTQRAENPYFGIVTYIILPGSLILGLIVIVAGINLSVR